jgi:hypothetical protein
MEDIFLTITNDKDNMNKIKKSIDSILKDGKIDQYDIPDIVFLVTDLLNSLTTLRVSPEEVSVLIKKICSFVLDTYGGIPDEKKPEFERLLDSSLRLVMLQPKVKAAVSSCLAFLKCKPTSKV